MNKLLVLLFAPLMAFGATTTFQTDNLQFGKPTNADKTLFFKRNSLTPPGLRWHESSSTMQFTNDGSTWSDIPTSLTQPPQNLLLNGGFDWWVRGLSLLIANGSTAYEADRWMVKNSTGTNGVITFFQATGVAQGSQFQANVQISTAPTAAQANGTELFQIIPALTTRAYLYGKTASFGILVAGLGNVNQVGIQFMYATTETAPTTGIGSEVLCSVTTGAFTLCQINGQAMGTSMTTSGSVAVRIRPTAVSSGNLYDLNNGFHVEQAIVNTGTAAAAFARSSYGVESEQAAIGAYYQQSYDYGISSGSSTQLGAHIWYCPNANIHCASRVIFKTRMRQAPVMVFWDLAGNINKVTSYSVAAFAQNNNQAGLVLQLIDSSGFVPDEVTTTTTGNIAIQWLADSEIH